MVFKVPLLSEKKNVLLIITSLGCLDFTVHNLLCAQFESRRLFSHSSDEGG